MSANWEAYRDSASMDCVPLVTVCVSSCSWETFYWWENHIWEKERRHRPNWRKQKYRLKLACINSVTWSTKLIRAVKEWGTKKRRKGARWSRARQTQTWAHIPLPDYKIPASCRRVETDYTHTQKHMHAHWHLGSHPLGNRCKLRHTCRNTNSVIDITDMHTHAHMLGREEIPEGTGGSGDSNLSGWLWSLQCLCHHCWNTLDGSRLFLISHNVHMHAKML